MTTRFFEHSKIERHDFPAPNERGFSMTLNTAAAWLVVPAEVETSLEGASDCKLPGDQNKVRTFLKAPLSVNELTARHHLSLKEAEVVMDYYQQAGKALRERKVASMNTLLFPGVYGQCLLSHLRQKFDEGRSLELYQKLTGYPVTDDLKHVCRKCQTSMLYPAMHTLEHTVRMRYPSVALGDSSDLGGHTFLGHPQTGAPVIFWYDNYMGGLGAADKIFEQIGRLLDASLSTLTGCGCTTLEGCPNCTQLGSCDVNNDGLSKLAGQMLACLAMGQPYAVPFEPYVYQATQKTKFEAAYHDNEYVEQPHGVGSERPREAGAEEVINPYQLLRVQALVHDPVLAKALEVRSVEIARELPPVSAIDLNRAFNEIMQASRPQEWAIRAGLSPYQVLEILPLASLKMIQGVYRVIAREVHPDMYKGNKDRANEMMQLVNDAYQQLQNQKKHKEPGYDDN